MTKQTISEVKARKNFYRDNYRRSVIGVFISLGVSLLLLMGIFVLVVTRSVPDHYATSGVASPIMLTPLSQPNNSGEYLLEPDPIDEMAEKELFL